MTVEQLEEKLDWLKQLQQAVGKWGPLAEAVDSGQCPPVTFATASGRLVDHEIPRFWQADFLRALKNCVTEATTKASRLKAELESLA